MNKDLELLRELIQDPEKQKDTFYNLIKNKYRNPSISQIIEDRERNFSEQQNTIFENNLKSRLFKHRKTLDNDDKFRFRKGIFLVAIANILMARARIVAKDPNNNSKFKLYLSKIIPLKFFSYKAGLFVLFPFLSFQSILLVNFNNKIAYKYTFIDMSIDIFEQNKQQDQNQLKQLQDQSQGTIQKQEQLSQNQKNIQ